MDSYSHTQERKRRDFIKTIFISVLLLLIVAPQCIRVVSLFSNVYVGLISVGLLFLIGILVSLFFDPTSSTVTVDDTSIVLSLKYIFSSWSQKISLDNIASIEPITNYVPLFGKYRGTSFFFSSEHKGKALQIAGDDYLKILQKDGTVFLLGTDDINRLYQEVQNRLKGFPTTTPLPKPISNIPFQAFQMMGLLIAGIVILIIFTFAVLRNV